VGFARVRLSKDGQKRYIALYRDQRGQVRSAGTYSTQKQADKAWQKAEAKLLLERLPDARRGRQRFQRYVEDVWFPNHVIELRTRENYDYEINRYIMPWFGTMRMVDILPIDVREWVTHLQNEGVNPPTIRYCMTILSAIFTTALNDLVIVLHPCKGVKTPPIPKKKRVIITPEQFDALYAALPDTRMQLLARAQNRDRFALGRDHRAPSQGHRLERPHTHHQPRRYRTRAQTPPRGRPVSRQGLPQGPRTPQPQT